MPVYYQYIQKQQSKMDSVYSDDTPAAEDDVCEVKIGNGEVFSDSG